MSRADETTPPEPGMRMTTDSTYLDFFSNQMQMPHGDESQQKSYGDPAGLQRTLGMDLDMSSYPFMSTLSPFGSPEAQTLIANGQAISNASPLQTIDHSEDGCPQVIGLSSDMDPYLVHQYNADESGFFHFKQLSIHSVQSEPYPVQFLTSRRSMVSKSREDSGDVELPEVQLRTELEAVVSTPIGKRLLSLFHTYVEPQYPIFSTESALDPDSTPVYLLAAIYAVTFPFSMYDDQLCIELAYDTPPFASLSRLINVSLRPEIHSPTISIAQTLLVILIRPLSNPLVAEAPYKGSLVASLASVAITIGLHLDAASWNIPTWQIALRRRLSFVIWSIDKWVAASLGRPRQLRDDDWVVTSLQMTDRTGTDLSDAAWRDLEFMSNLTEVLDTTLGRLFSLRASERITHDHVYASSVSRELLRSLPGISENTLRGDNEATAVVTLGYHYVKLLIIRPVSKPELCLPAGHDGNNSQPGQHNLEDTEALSHSLIGFVNFVKSIKTDSTQVFWPPWCPTAISTLCFALLSAVVTSKSESEATEWLTLLQSTRRDLRLKATTLPVLRLGLLRIDSIFWRGLDKVLRLEPHVQRAVQSSITT